MHTPAYEAPRGTERESGDNKGSMTPGVDDQPRHHECGCGTRSDVQCLTFSYQFILVFRSPYFRAQLLSWVSKSTAAAAPGDPLTITLLSPPFTPVSLRFTLGYTYTGTLVFSRHTCDLDTAFAILRAATYLSLPQLYDDETQVHAAYEMLHGLYHAFPEFEEYERITGANWGTGRCHCR